MTITLPPDLEKPLAEQARKQGTTPEILALDTLRQQFPAESAAPEPEGGDAESEPQTLYDFLKDYIGVISSSEHVPGGARMSENTGAKFTEGLLEKRRQGRL